MDKDEQRVPGVASPKMSSKRRSWLSMDKDRVKDVAGIVALVLITTKVGLPLLGKIGGLLFGRKKEGQTKPSTSLAKGPTGDLTPSEDKWQVLTAAAPPIPEDLKEIFSCDLACSVKDFYRWFLSGTSDFHKQLHIKLEGRDDFFYGPWQAAPEGHAPLGSPCNPDDNSYLAASGRSPFDFTLGAGPGSGGFIRNLVFVQPKKGAQNVDANCVQRQQFCVYQGDVLVLATAQNMLNIPFKDCFTVNTCWVVKPSADGSGCTLTVHLKVNFVKGCLVGGIIKMTTINSNKEFFKLYADACAKAIAAGGPPPAAEPSKAGTARAVSAQPSPIPPSETLMETMPVRRQLLVAALFVMLLACFGHQIMLDRDLAQARKLLEAVVKKVGLAT